MTADKTNAAAADPGTKQQGAAGSGRPLRPAKQLFASTVLVLEAFVGFFAALVAFGLRLAEPGQVAAVGGAMVLVALLGAGLVRVPVGLVLGWAVQACLLLSGLVLPAMFVVAAVFLALWVVGLRVGGRIDRERAERLAAR